MMQQNIIALGVMSITWVVIGYSLAFGTPLTDGGSSAFRSSCWATWTRRRLRRGTSSTRASPSRPWPSWPTR